MKIMACLSIAWFINIIWNQNLLSELLLENVSYWQGPNSEIRRK